MAVYYADSSVLVKRHISEIGSAWVKSITNVTSDNLLTTAQITQVEGLSALNRRVREGAISMTQYTKLANNWMILCATRYRLVALSPEAVVLSRRLLET